jgi:hypothetical protein
MKKSVIRRDLEAFLTQSDISQVFRLMEDHGATWDPEEPELPERIEAYGTLAGDTRLGPERPGPWRSVKQMKVTHYEAARRYNLWPAMKDKVLDARTLLCGPLAARDHESGRVVIENLLTLLDGGGK